MKDLDFRNYDNVEAFNEVINEKLKAVDDVLTHIDDKIPTSCVALPIGRELRCQKSWLSIYEELANLKWFGFEDQKDVNVGTDEKPIIIHMERQNTLDFIKDELLSNYDTTDIDEAIQKEYNMPCILKSYKGLEK